MDVGFGRGNRSFYLHGFPDERRSRIKRGAKMAVLYVGKVTSGLWHNL